MLGVTTMPAPMIAAMILAIGSAIAVVFIYYVKNRTKKGPTA
jgi:hypothetical protein